METLPQTMKAFTIPTRSMYEDPSPIDSITLHAEYPIPKPMETQYLIRVNAAAITPFELTWPNTLASQPRVPCHDVSGTILSLPSSSSSPKFLPGDKIFALLPMTSNGALAEYAVCSEEYLCHAPSNISMIEAASLPRAGLTVLQSVELLQESGFLIEGNGKAGEEARKRNPNILITGATGAVGRMAVQIFRHFASKSVVSTEADSKAWIGCLGGTGSSTLCEDLGADYAVNYREEEHWEEGISDALRKHKGADSKIDIIFDTIGSSCLTRLLPLLSHNAFVLSVASPPTDFEALEGWGDVEAKGVIGKWLLVKGTGLGLGVLKGLVEGGKVRCSVGGVVGGLSEKGVRDGWEKGWKGGVGGGVVVDVWGGEEGNGE